VCELHLVILFHTFIEVGTVWQYWAFWCSGNSLRLVFGSYPVGTSTGL